MSADVVTATGSEWRGFMAVLNFDALKPSPDVFGTCGGFETTLGAALGFAMIAQLPITALERTEGFRTTAAVVGIAVPGTVLRRAVGPT